MKKLFYIPVILVVFAATASAQTQDSLRNIHYGIEVNQFITGSGFRTGTEVHFSVIEDNRKQISLGLYYCSELKKITGITIHHEMTLIRAQRGHVPLITPFVFYNLIYRKTKMHEVLDNNDQTGAVVTYTSMEQHLGIGAKIKLGPALFINTEAGYGVYLGSIKKPAAPNPLTGEIMGTNGFCALIKIGIGIKL
jgi:hypothetical protein